MSKTLGPSYDAQDESDQNLPRMVVIGTFGAVRLPLLELLNQSDPSKKFDQNRQAPKRGNSAQRVADFDLSATKKRLKFLPIVLFQRLRRIFNHNSFSDKRLEQNEPPLLAPTSGSGLKLRFLRGLDRLEGYQGQS